jgi:hypothetical protein
MKTRALNQAKHFIQNEKQFHLRVQALKGIPAVTEDFVSHYGNSLGSLMTGGDYALVRGV